MDVIFEKCLKKTGINIRESPGGLPFYECAYIVSYIYIYGLVVLTILKNISQWEGLSHI